MTAAATPQQLQEFTDRLGVQTSVQTDAEGRPQLEAEGGEEVSAAFGDVEVAIGDEGLSLGKGTCYVTTRRIIWLATAAAAGAPPRRLALRFPQIIMHAVSNDAGSFPRACVYLQLDEGSVDGDAPTGVGGGAGAAGGSGSGEEGGDEGEEGVSAELRLVPGDAEAVEALFKAMCDCSALNPDSDNEDDGQAELFFDEAEALAGLPAAERDALLAARAEGALGVRDDIDELMQEDPDRFEDDEDEGGGGGGGGANGTAA
ncbi:MAG: regulator of volume decrease after cellular swelling-domain-containing protein [Monoraphidium minutum]|nr:MAG: regulator of volume decrease after cellular swelling-domain-containing protein [Monoraphidium minutum]